MGGKDNSGRNGTVTVNRSSGVNGKSFGVHSEKRGFSNKIKRLQSTYFHETTTSSEILRSAGDFLLCIQAEISYIAARNLLTIQVFLQVCFHSIFFFGRPHFRLQSSVWYAFFVCE